MTEDYDFFKVTYGSKLYGTNTPTSDTDVKVVYIPAIEKLLLGKKLNIYKNRFDADMNPIGDGFTMPDNGTEVEYFPIQTFVRDFVNGQTYALEMAFAILSYGRPQPGIAYTSTIGEYLFIEELVEKFANAEVYSMVGFAMKQTFDYVRRGERLNDAKKVLAAVDEAIALTGDPISRLNHTINEGQGDEFILDRLARLTGLETGMENGGNKPQRCLKLNGRSYLEATTLEHLRNQVQKIVSGFGDRSTAAAEEKVDFKSLSHAVRVYQQSIELLDTGKITFPRPNAEFLLSVKQGKEDLEQVKRLLMALDDEVKEKMETSTMRKKTPELLAESETWLAKKLRGPDFYNIEED